MREVLNAAGMSDNYTACGVNHATVYKVNWFMQYCSAEFVTRANGNNVAAGTGQYRCYYL